MKPLKKIKKKPAKKAPSRGRNIVARGFQVLTGRWTQVIAEEKRADRRAKGKGRKYATKR